MANHSNARTYLFPAAIILAAGVARPALTQTVTFQEMYTFYGDGVNDIFGISVSGAGDVNGDGFDDVIAGAPRGDSNGIARVFSGADGSELFTFIGDSSSDWFGYSVSGAGDVDGDGFYDLIVGARLDDNNGSRSGSARVFSGADGSVLYTFDGASSSNEFGYSVSGAGDVNGDGFDDLIVGERYCCSSGGSEGRAGNAFVFSGADGSVLHTFDGSTDPNAFGSVVSDAGDVNGDGFDDLLIGEYPDSSNGSFSGRASVLSGDDGAILFNFYGDNDRDFMGGSVSSAGDVNGDGFPDLIVGANGNDTNGSFAGSARVFSGVDGSILYTFYGDDEFDLFGLSVSGAGDVNGDGYSDLLVGARRDDNNGNDSGSASVFSGADGSVLATFNGEGEDDIFGTSVSSAGDVNGDGFDDIAIGALGINDPIGSSSGYVKVFVVVPRLCADQDGDGLATPSDFSAWIANFNAMSLIADVNRDRLVTPADFSAWVAAFNQGESGPTCVP
ncbi:MAG: FG-GAP repeat protein [Phycisphaerales bacterium]|nr:FG-GAP repeat protein [Phycisphaerales bacterium]MCB9836732.1 FG-GAP repeat protein [Phycisphaera sp.]